MSISTLEKMNDSLKTRRKVRPSSAPAAEGSASRSNEWLAELAEPYLREYLPSEALEDELTGYWFASPLRVGSSKESVAAEAECGFFAGYLKSSEKYSYLNSKTPECLVFAWFREPGGAEHARLVGNSGSLLRKTHTYIGWLTHRPPQFELYTDQFIALIRHRTMLDWPVEKREHYSRNFFIETLAWLVRSGLVKKLKSGDGSEL